MTDRYDQDLILGYVEGELDDAQRAAFEATLADDHELRNLVSQLKLDRENLHSLGNATAPLGLIDQVIQSHERAELLGDPESPEPLPLALPVNRHRVRRVLAYSGIAAVLLLSAALVIPSLMPSGLLDKTETLALDDQPTKSRAPAVPDSGAGLALRDEDAAYDRLDPRAHALARVETAKPTAVEESAGLLTESTEPGDSPAMARAEQTPEPAAAMGLSDSSAEAGDAPAATIARAEDKEEPADTAPAAGAMAGMQTADAADQPTRTEAMESVGPLALTEPAAVTRRAEADQRVGPDTPTPLLKQEPQSPAEARVDPFGGYADASTPKASGASGATALAEHTQLLINAPSPRQARQELRNWALTNSARVTRTVAEGTPEEPQGTPKLFIEVAQDKVPQLLAFLNRAPGTHAQLLAASSGPTRSGMAGEDATGTTADEAPAAANRMRDIRTWPDTAREAQAPSDRRANGTAGLAMGLTSSGNDSNTPAQPDAEDQPDPREPEPRRDPGATFDIGKLLESLRTQPKPAPLLQPEPGPIGCVTLEVVVRQVAEESPEDTTENH